MEPEQIENPPVPQPKAIAPESTTAPLEVESTPLFAEAAKPEGPPEPGTFGWVFSGKNGLRAGWSVALFLPLMMLFSALVGAVFFATHLIDGQAEHGGPRTALLSEIILLAGLTGAAALVSLLEQRPKNLLAYNLLGPRRGFHFVTGLVAGFAALALLVGALHVGGWLTLASAGLAAPQIAQYALLWGLTFLMVGLYEEGLFRCYLQATLTRGINLWLARGLEASMCGWLLWRGKGNGLWGVYGIALLGFAPCLYLVWKKAEGNSFWLAAWVTSTLFGFVHTGNNGENWIGIFAAGAIGFVFVVSVRLTGSAWWAIGFHAAWDWAETFFFGTADSGMPAVGSFLVAKPAGNPFWSGGTNGPEGSLLVLGIILLVLVALVAAYGRKGLCSHESR